ncbi:subtilase-type protease inhibitor [Streptomyces poriticola]|uniref:subtilase-type protease inhibitor n=1 Tax=Streptomyces poriticola TaxID=3120506 RepID=UPI002FCE033D
MRNTARWATTLGLAITTALGPLAGAAGAAPAGPAAQAAPDSAPASLYAPSALVLTVAHGENAASATPMRAATLSCAPTPSGTHPDPALACAELRGAGGDLHALTATDGVMCTKEYDPVVVTVEGVWEGRRIADERTFANPCVKNAHSASVFAF